MVTKKKARVTGAKKEGKVKVGKLKINKETVKNLTDGEVKGIKGGQRPLSNKNSCVGACCLLSNHF